MILLTALLFTTFYFVKRKSKNQSKTTETTTKTQITTQTTVNKTTETQSTTQTKVNKTTKSNEENNTELLFKPENKQLRKALFNVSEDYKSKHKYIVAANLKTNLITLYEKEDGKYQKPVKAMICSCGLENSPTTKGEFKLTEKMLWCLMIDKTYGRYVIRFNGPYMTHSVPYERKTKDSLLYKEFNKLGQPASHGCLRLSLEDSKFLYDNVNFGTKIIVYESEIDTMPRPKKIIIDENSPLKTWDPTDPERPQ